MQKTACWLFVFLVFTSMLLAQNVRVNSGTSLPANCTEGDHFVKTDAAAGQREYICVATDIWEQQTGGGGGGSVNSVFGRTGAVTANSGDYSASQVLNAFDVTVGNALTNAVAPGTPSAGKTSVWSDSSDKILKSKNDAGTIAVTVVPDAGTANNFLTSISPAGVISKAQPSCSSLSNATASCSTDTTNASNIASGTLDAARLPTEALTTSSTATTLEAPLFCADAGANDTYACNLSPAIASYVTGTHYRFKANTANTGAASINFNSKGALTIKKFTSDSPGADLADNDIRAGQWVEVVYDGTNAQMVSTTGNAASGGDSPGGSDNAAQYRTNSTTLGGVTLNTGADRKFVSQISSGAPTMQPASYLLAKANGQAATVLSTGDNDITGGSVAIGAGVIPVGGGLRLTLVGIATGTDTKTVKVCWSGSSPGTNTCTGGTLVSWGGTNNASQATFGLNIVANGATNAQEIVGTTPGFYGFAGVAPPALTAATIDTTAATNVKVVVGCTTPCSNGNHDFTLRHLILEVLQ